MLEILKLLGTGGSGALVPIVVMYQYFTPQEVFYLHTAESRIGTIISLQREIPNMPDGVAKDTMCDTLAYELSALCLQAGDHPLCRNQDMILNEVGC